MYRGDWATIQCSLQKRSGREVRPGLALVGGHPGFVLGWSLGRMSQGDGRRAGRLIDKLVVFLVNTIEKNSTYWQCEGGVVAMLQSVLGWSPPGS